MRSLLIVLCLLTQPCLGQIGAFGTFGSAIGSQSEFEVVPAVTGIGPAPQIYGDVLLLEKDAKPSFMNVGRLSLVGEFDVSDVAGMKRGTGEPVNIVKVSETIYLVEGTGSITLWISTVTREPFSTKLGFKSVTIGAPDPPPPPPPNPDNPSPDNPTPDPSPVPEDQFDNLGQRISAAIAEPLQNQMAVAQLYKKAADELNARPLDTEQISIELLDGRRKVAVSSDWQSVLTLIATDFNKRRPAMKRADLIMFWLTVSRGLGLKGGE